MQLIGNDIVDLSTAEARTKDKDSRFMRRVMSVHERERVKSARNSAQVLWMCWAAKEAAFKVMRKLRSKTVFSPVQFETSFTTGNPVLSEVRGSVTYQDFELDCRWEIHENYIHALCVYGQEKDASVSYEIMNQSTFKNLSEILTSCQQLFSPKEKQSIFRDESYLVRYFFKKALSRNLGCEESELQVVREKVQDQWQAPAIIFDNKRFPADLSLSHDGDFLAYAFSAVHKPQLV